jgi:hypothetical protein
MLGTLLAAKLMKALICSRLHPVACHRFHDELKLSSSL